MESKVVTKVLKQKGAMVPGQAVTGRVEVNGVTVEYRAHMPEDGTVNIGTIFPVK